MSILNELREEANRKKAEELERQDSQQVLEAVYRAELLPAMQSIYKFFKEIVEYLEYLKEPIIISQYSSKYKGLSDLTQQDYKIKTDKYGGAAKLDELTEITLRYYYIGDEAFTIDIFSQAEIDQHIKLLSAHKVPFDWSRQMNAATNSIATFTIEKKIPVIIKFEVDMTTSVINLKIINHMNFDVTKRSYKGAEINEEFLDKLTRYLLHKDSSFIQVDISDEEREILKARLKANLDNPETPVKTATSENNSLVGKLKSLFGK